MGGAAALHLGRRENVAEIGGDAGKPLFDVLVHRQRQSLDPAQVAGDDFGAGLVQKKPRAVKKLHQRAGARKAAFGEEHQPAFAFQISGHVFGRVRRHRVDWKGAPVEHDLAIRLPVGTR